MPHLEILDMAHLERATPVSDTVYQHGWGRRDIAEDSRGFIFMSASELHEIRINDFHKKWMGSDDATMIRLFLFNELKNRQLISPRNRSNTSAVIEASTTIMTTERTETMFMKSVLDIIEFLKSQLGEVISSFAAGRTHSYQNVNHTKHNFGYILSEYIDAAVNDDNNN